MEDTKLLLEFELDDRYGYEYVFNMLKKSENLKNFDIISFPQFPDLPEFYLSSVKVEFYGGKISFETEIRFSDIENLAPNLLTNLHNSNLIRLILPSQQKNWDITTNNIQINVSKENNFLNMGFGEYSYASYRDSFTIRINFSAIHLVESDIDF